MSVSCGCRWMKRCKLLRKCAQVVEESMEEAKELVEEEAKKEKREENEAQNTRE